MQAHHLAVLAVLGLSVAPASAETAPPLLCHEQGELRRALLERYREVPVSIGLQTDGQLLQVFASAETGTWTILSTRPDGIACILAAGKHFEQRPLASPRQAAGATERAG